MVNIMHTDILLNALSSNKMLVIFYSDFSEVCP